MTVSGREKGGQVRVVRGLCAKFSAECSLPLLCGGCDARTTAKLRQSSDPSLTAPRCPTMILTGPTHRCSRGNTFEVRSCSSCSCFIAPSPVLNMWSYGDGGVVRLDFRRHSSNDCRLSIWEGLLFPTSFSAGAYWRCRPLFRISLHIIICPATTDLI